MAATPKLTQQGRNLSLNRALWWFLFLNPWKVIVHDLPIWCLKHLTNIMVPFLAQEVEETYPEEY